MSEKIAKTKCVTVDEALSKFRVFGRYHMTALVFLFLAFVTNNMYVSNYVFAVEKVHYRCKSTTNQCNTHAFDSETSKESNCIQHSYDNGTSCFEANGSLLRPCQEWEYDDPHSFVAEFELACQEWKRTLVGSVHSFGLMIGLLFVGPISDRFGRKTSIIITGVLGGVFGLIRSYVTNYWIYVVLEFLEASFGDICSPTFMLALELISAKERVLYMTLAHFGLQTGGIIVASIAWYFPYWRHFLRVIYTPALLFVFYIFAIDESPRWLLLKNKKKQATALFEKASKMNKIPMDTNMLENIKCIDDDQKQEGFLTVLRITFTSKVLLRRVLVAFVWWISSIFCYYGVLINSVFLEGNKYLNFILLSLVDIPAVTIMGYILEKFNRKKPLMISFSGAAVFFMIQPFMPNNLPSVSLILYLAGRFSVTIYFGITYIYTSELFPTETRNTLHAMCSSVGRIGSIIAPQTPLLMVYWNGFPSIIFSGASLLAAILTLTVPDVKDDDLPDSIRQAEAFGVECDTKV